MSIPRRPARIAAATIVACGALAAAAFGNLISSSGGAQTQMFNDTETVSSTTSNTAWTTIPGWTGAVLTPDAATATIVVPDNQSRLVNARFTAESRCYGNLSGTCRMRIVAYNAAGGAVELSPASGPDYAFDSDVAGATDTDMAESHAMERSFRLPAGPWRIRAERSVSNLNNTFFLLDDWHFAVEVSI